MNKSTFVTVLLLLVAQLNFSQNINKRVSINNPDQSILNSLASSGIDLRCGVHHTGNSIILDLTEPEIKSLKQKNVPFSIEIEDLTKFYAERAKRELPNAQENLKKEKLNSKKQKTNIASKLSSSITSTTVDSYLQYQGEQEVDWIPPTNFNIPSTFGGCLTVSETEAELDAMRTAYPNLITVKMDASPSDQTTYGFSGTNGWAGQTVYYVKISDNPDGADDPNEPDILYTSMIHSRELSSLMGNIYFMWYLLENYATDSAIKHLVDNNELYFVPIVNPDGLRWNEKEDPNGGGMNRTNLRGYSTPSNPANNSNYIENYGVDPNRNFDYLWGSAGDSSGSSGNYTWSTYRGPDAFSEPETEIMRDFILARNFKTAVWQHSYANAIPHPYGGIPTKTSGREDEMVRWHQDMTKYNRYIYGANVLSAANGIADDWMLGGTIDTNGSVGSGQYILATTPENGANNGSEGGFWPDPNQIVPIAKRMVRINLMNAYYGGKYAKFHDLTQSDITSLTSDLKFAIERVGQSSSDFTITVTPISSNIASVGSAVTEIGMNVLEQRNVTIQLNLNSGISANDIIEYKVTLSNSDGGIYEANFVKYYNPSILFSDNPDSDNLSNWTSSGDWATTSDSWSGTAAIRFGTSSPYGIDKNRTLTTLNSYDLSTSDQTIIQFYSKWDMERNFDFVDFQGSTDGTNWVSLKGNYNKPESSIGTNSARSSYNSSKNSYFSFQSNSLGFIYDGDQMDNWIMEEVVIDTNNNSSLFNASNAQFRFVFRSDGNNSIEKYSTTLDGFYFDDFRIIKISIPCVTDVPTGLVASSLTTNSANIDWNSIPSATYDIQYRVVGAPSWTEITDIAANSYPLTGLSESTDYEVQVRSRCGTSTSNYSSTVNFTTLTAVPCSGTQIISYPYTETFDSGIGDWLHDPADHGEWTLNSGGTPSSNTGPGDDFSTGGNYFYMEANNLSTNDIINLISPCFDLTSYTNSSFSFYYHMFGNRMGTLKLDVTSDNGGAWTNLVSITGQQHASSGSAWTQRTVNLSAYVGETVKLRLSGTRGNGRRSDMAIDNIALNCSNDLLIYSSNSWSPSTPTNATGAYNALIQDGIYTINSDIELNDVTINPSAETEISNGQSLTLNGDLTNNGLLTLNSDSDEYSSLIVNGTVTGDVQYKRHVNSNSLGNDLISAPVIGERFDNFALTNPNIYENSGDTSVKLFGPFNKTEDWYQTYDTDLPADAAVTLDSGIGYRAASSDNGTFTFTGTVNTETINKSIVHSGFTYQEWNLIGNPYPSYIKLDDFLTTNNGSFDLNRAGIYGYNAQTTNKWEIWNSAYALANPNALIAPGQGFFVASQTGGANVSFTSGMRSTGNSDDFIANRNANNSGISFLKLQLNRNTQSYPTDFYFTDNASLGLDPGYDAGVFGGSAPSFAIYSQLVNDNQGIDMAVQSVGNSDLNNNVIIPLGINASQGQQLTVSIEHATLPDNFNVYLEDNVANTVTLLNNNDYIFTPDTNLSDVGRFFLRFENETLSTIDNELNELVIYNTNLPKVLHIKGQLTDSATLYLYDVQGRNVVTEQLKSYTNSQQLDISNIVSGIYIATIDSDNASISKKLIIK